MNPEGRGGFRRGQSGNPGGRPKEVGYVRKIAREYSKEAIARLVAWMRCDNPKVSVAASLVLIQGCSTLYTESAIQHGLTI